MASKHLLLTILFILGITTSVRAQNEEVLERYFNHLSTQEELESGAVEQIIEQLTWLTTHPQNINTATRDDFEALPFLNDAQIEKLCEYLYRYGPIRSIGELAMIPELDSDTRSLLMACFYIGEVTDKQPLNIGNVMRYGKHEIVVTGKIPFYTRRGDENGYLGTRYAHSLRYSFKYGDKLTAGLIAANEAGEPFFKHDNKWGYDHYALHLQIKQQGILKQAVIGHYRIRMGQGLIFNSNFSLGKLTQLDNAARNTVSITPHLSKMQHNYLQGAAATVSLNRHFELSAFASYRGIDATLSNDGTTVSTILTTGYHRTVVEMAKKHNVDETIIGGHLTYDTHKGFVFGLSGVYDKLSKPLQPNKSQSYRRYYPTGNSFANYSIDYSYRSHHLSVAGETALDKEGNIATLNHIIWRPLSDLRITLSQRFYGYKYNALHAEAFSDGGSVKNESGVYLGANWRLSSRSSIQAYTDYAYFAWDKYQAKGSSKSWDNLIQGTFPIKGVTLFARYRFKTRQINPSGKSELWWRQEHRIRLSASYAVHALNLKTQVDASHYQLVKSSKGWMISQQADMNVTTWLKLYATVAYFNTDDYNSRLYLYEHQPMYAIYIPAYFNKGIRYSLFAHANLRKNLTLNVSLGTTDYFNRKPIGSGLQEVNRSSMTDMNIQLRWTF